MAGKHETDEKLDIEIPWKKIIIIILCVLLVCGISLGIYWGKEKFNNDKQVEEPEVVKESNFPEEIKGYKVLGKLYIESIGIEKYILDSFEDTALENGIGKLTGNNLNEPGNFVIVGHNYDDVFKKLEELEVGNKFTIENSNEEKTNYVITEISTIEPTELSNLLPKDDTTTQITLITCQSGATSRLIVKAEKEIIEEVSDENEIDVQSEEIKEEN